MYFLTVSSASFIFLRMQHGNLIKSTIHDTTLLYDLFIYIQTITAHTKSIAYRNIKSNNYNDKKMLTMCLKNSTI